MKIAPVAGTYFRIHSMQTFHRTSTALQMLGIFFFISLLLISQTLLAQPAGTISTPAGRWRTIDESTGGVRSILEISQVGDQFMGKVVKIFLRPGEKPFCNKCDGALKGQPVLGMTILWDLKQ